MGIYGGSDGPGQAVADPQADHFSRDAAFLATADIGMPELMDVMIGQYPFDRRGDRPGIGGFCLCKIDVR